MKHRKISGRLAYEIGDAISRKAFAHLRPAVEEQLKAVMQEAYQQAEAQLDFTALKNFNIVEEVDNVRLAVRPMNGADKEVKYLTGKPGYQLGASSWAVMTVYDDELFARADVLNSRLKDMQQRTYDMARELQDQLKGRTTKQAIEAWPEAADIIAKVAGVETSSFTRPLEVLLAKYMPMLPAPATQEV